MLEEFYDKAGLSRKNFQRWAKELTKGFISGVDYQKIDGKFSFEPTTKVIVLMRLAKRYPKDFTTDDIHQALVEASIKIKPFYVLDNDYFWPSIVHAVHVIWHSRRKDKLAEVGDNEVGEAFLTITVDENDDIVLSAPKILLPEADSIMKESTSTIQPKQEQEQEQEEDDDFIIT